MQPIDRPLWVTLVGMALVGLGVYLGSTLDVSSARDWVSVAGPVVIQFLGLGAAIYAAFLVLAQLREMSRQSAAAAIAALLPILEESERDAALVDRLQKERTELRTALRRIVEFTGGDARPLIAARGSLAEIAGVLSEGIDRFHALKRRENGGARRLMDEVTVALILMRHTTNRLIAALNAHLGPPLGQPSLPLDTVRSNAKVVAETFAAVDRALELAANHFTEENVTVWQSIRDFKVVATSQRPAVGRDDASGSNG